MNFDVSDVSPAFGVPVTNPFATRFIRPGSMPFLVQSVAGIQEVDTDWLGELAERVRTSKRSVIVGPHGSGKSTLLHWLKPHLAPHYRAIQSVQLSRFPSPEIRVYVNNHRENLRRIVELLGSVERESLVMVDGIEQLFWGVRVFFSRLLSRRRCDILATSHRKLAGWVPVVETSLTPELIRHLAMKLVKSSDGHVQSLVRGTLDRRDLREVSNARDLWFELYDVVAPAVSASSPDSKPQ